VVETFFDTYRKLRHTTTTTTTSMYDYCVIGGGVAGLGVALPLARKFQKTVVVLDRSRPHFDGADRFRPSAAASFKNAGILELGVLSDIRAYFTSETVRLYREMGVDVRELGAVQPTTSTLDRALVSRFLRPFSPSAAAASSKAKAKAKAKATTNLDVPSTNKGVFAFPKGSNAEPEHTMRVLHDHARGTRGLAIRYGIEVTSLVREMCGADDDTGGGGDTNNASRRIRPRTSQHHRAPTPTPTPTPTPHHKWRWRVHYSGGSCTATHVVVAAGPGSSSLLRRLGIDIGVTHVYGIMGESSVLTTPFYAGNIIASDAEVRWIARDALVSVASALSLGCLRGGGGGAGGGGTTDTSRRLLDRTHCTAVWDGTTVTQLYRHLYAAVQLRRSGLREVAGAPDRAERRLCLGGPRIELPSTLNVDEFDRLKPHMFEPEWDKCVAYLSQLVTVPPHLTFEPQRRWGGVMAFADDERGPLVGTLDGFDGTLHVHTAYESSGFRQAVGGGSFLAHLLCSGPQWADDLASAQPLVRNWRQLLPSSSRCCSVSVDN